MLCPAPGPLLQSLCNQTVELVLTAHPTQVGGQASTTWGSRDGERGAGSCCMKRVGLRRGWCWLRTPRKRIGQPKKK